MQCITPFEVKTDKGRFPVPCGKCYPCKARRTSGWSFRLLKEAERSSSAFFITLTYADPPISNNGLPTLNQRHVQAWIKAMRKLHDKKLVYYYVGEYGSKYERPHYHILLFNAELKNIIGTGGVRSITSGFDTLDGTVEHNHSTWKHGYITIGKLEAASVAYCLQYISKGTKIPAFDGDDREKEFARMSKGIGENYVTPQMKQHHAKQLNNPSITLIGGKKIAIPRYLKNKLFTEEQRQHIADIFKVKAEQNDWKQISEKEYLEN